MPCYEAPRSEDGLTEEVWRPIPGYEQFYMASSHGRVKTLGRLVACKNGRSFTTHPKVMAPAASKKSKYFSLQLSTGFKTTTKYVHHLILETFVGPKPTGMEACHGDGNRQNNRLGNLRWDTRKNNHADKRQHGTHGEGELHPSSKLSDDDVRKLRARRAEGASATTLGLEFNVDRMTAYRAATGRSWSHLK